MRKIIPIFFLVVDIVLAGFIIKAYIGERGSGTVSESIAQTFTSANGTVSEKTETTDSVSEETEAAEKTEAAEETEAAVTAEADEPKNFDTTERPDDADFLEWYAKDVMFNGIPEGVTRLTELSDILGSWKGLIYYDPENTEGSEAVELLNFLVDEGQFGLTLTADWYTIYWVNDGAVENEEDMEDFVFPATWSGGQLKGDRDSVITFTDFYEKEGRQYAFGTMETASGIPAKVAMVRP